MEEEKENVAMDVTKPAVGPSKTCNLPLNNW